MISIKDQDLIVKFGQHLRKVRESKNLSQENLAFTAEISTNQIGRIERGEINPTLSTLSVIAKALGMNLAELMEEI